MNIIFKNGACCPVLSDGIEGDLDTWKDASARSTVRVSLIKSPNFCICFCRSLFHKNTCSEIKLDVFSLKFLQELNGLKSWVWVLTFQSLEFSHSWKLRAQEPGDGNERGDGNAWAGFTIMQLTQPTDRLISSTFA